MKEALKLALEALQLHLVHHEHGCVYLDPAVTAIKKALAQPEQEPVAWGFRDHDGVIYDCISPEAHADCEGEYNVPLYDAPPKRIEELEALLERQTARIVDLQTHIENLEGEDR